MQQEGTGDLSINFTVVIVLPVFIRVRGEQVGLIDFLSSLSYLFDALSVLDGGTPEFDSHSGKSYWRNTSF
jgi:hypothetical protein